MVRRVAALLALAGTVAACLPGDTRPEPGSLLVTAGPTDATASGFVTDDGWTVSFERLLTALGDVDLDDLPDGQQGQDTESCKGYSETHYEWLYDFAVATPAKVGLVHGLGDCSVEFRLRGPSDDTVLGQGATDADVQRMRIEGTDDFVEEEEEVTVELHGTASKDGVVKRFDWSFRRSYDFEECRAAGSDDQLVTTFELTGGDRVTLELEVRGEELFRRAASDTAPLQFDLFAEADADGDGSVTLIELAGVEAPPESAVVETPTSSRGGDDEDEDEVEPPETMADLVYGFLLPRLARVKGQGACVADLRGGGGRF